MISYDRRPVERRKLVMPGPQHHFTIWIWTLIAIALAISILK
jgi:hypothetical protein